MPAAACPTWVAWAAWAAWACNCHRAGLAPPRGARLTFPESPQAISPAGFFIGCCVFNSCLCFIHQRQSHFWCIRQASGQPPLHQSTAGARVLRRAAPTAPRRLRQCTADAAHTLRSRLGNAPCYRADGTHAWVSGACACRAGQSGSSLGWSMVRRLGLRRWTAARAGRAALGHQMARIRRCPLAFTPAPARRAGAAAGRPWRRPARCRRPWPGAARCWRPAACPAPRPTGRSC